MQQSVKIENQANQIKHAQYYVIDYIDSKLADTGSSELLYSPGGLRRCTATIAIR